MTKPPPVIMQKVKEHESEEQDHSSKNTLTIDEKFVNEPNKSPSCELLPKI